MATLALAAAGAAVGSAVLPAGVSVFGATLTGAAIGTQIGALAGSVIDQALFGGQASGRNYEGPRLDELRVTASTEGAPIPRVFGAARIGGQVIWAADIEEVVTTEEVGGGGGGGKGGAMGRSQRATSTTYQYYASFAVAVAEGEITGLGRVWADGQELDLTNKSWRLHKGGETQEPDSLIAAALGSDSAPAFRGTAYVVFERLPLSDFGNRLPQLSFEVFRSVDRFSEQVRGVVMIPGSGEFVYATTPVTRSGPDAEQLGDNVHTARAETDFLASLDDLQSALPGVRSVSLVVSWFGSDLRAGHCTLQPGIDWSQKTTDPLVWSVAGRNRANAYEVSQTEGRANYGGTPSDQSVIEAIRELKARGIAVTLNPFILMDVPPDATLPDPYTPGAFQAPFPWRGRITVDPAPGEVNSPDQSTVAAGQVAAFTGTAAAAHFGLSGETVTYAGPDEWSYRRMILHYAHLAKAAGGVDAFLIGSEMRGLTHVRDGATSYPFVRDLIALASDVRAVLGPDTKITYAADWSEYFGHQPNDGSGDAVFHLDPLWSSPEIDAIGIDCYWPLSDWRDGDDHLDRTRAHSDSDLQYLKSNIAGGEGYDWYYASAEDRAAQVRAPITDGAGKPWVYRFKDLKSWWENPHFDRVGGSEVPAPTAWQPQSKPVWFMELGCPAIDKGANQPNVFWDEKSSESAWPYFSTGQANELIQRRYAQAFVEGYSNDAETSVAGLNPTSAVYGGPMVDLDRLHLYVWDARPYPAFPYDLDTWSDGGNWQTGHWLNGRAGANDLADVVRELFAAYGMTDVDVSGLAGLVPGFVLDRPMPLREAFQTLELAYFLDVVDSGGTLRITHRQDGPALLTVGDDDVVEEKVGASLISLTRGQESDLPQTVRINYVARDGRYAAEVADARRTTRSSRREATATLAVMLDDAQASSIAESWLYESWAMRERLNLSLPPSKLAVEPGDRLGVRIGKRTVTARIDEIADHGARVIEARAIDTAVYNAGPSPSRATQVTDAPVVGIATVAFLDLPLLDGTEPESAGYVAAAQSPWPGGINVYRSSSDTGYALATQIAAPSIMGTLAAPLAPSPSDRWTHPAGFDIRLISGELASRTDQDVFDGRNVAAIQHENGAWEVIQFAEAELIGPKHYRIRRVLRGQAGTDGEAVTEIPAGATFVLIDGRESQLEITPGDLNRALNWRYGPAGRDFGSAQFRVTQHAFAGLGARPLSPVHVRGNREIDGWHLSWVRRTRIGGDRWDQADVPLSEAREAYEIDILDDGTVVRTLQADTTALVYAADDAIADFGLLPEAIDCRIYQMSEAFGRGAPAIASLATT